MLSEVPDGTAGIAKSVVTIPKIFPYWAFSLPSVSVYGYPADADVAVAGVTVADRRRSRDPSRRTGNGTDSVYDTDYACGTDGDYDVTLRRVATKTHCTVRTGNSLPIPC